MWWPRVHTTIAIRSPITGATLIVVVIVLWIMQANHNLKAPEPGSVCFMQSLRTNWDLPFSFTIFFS